MEFFSIIFDFLTGILNVTENGLDSLFDWGSSLSSNAVADA